MRKQTLRRTLILVLSAMLALAYAQRASSSQTPPLLGVTFTHYKLQRAAIGACHPKGPGGDPSPLKGNAIIPQYSDPVVRATVREELAETRRAGIETIRSLLWFSNRWPNAVDGPLPSDPALLTEEVVSKVENFAHDVAAAGFKRLTVAFGPLGKNSPSCRRLTWGDCFEPERTKENWRFISVMRKAIARGAGRALNVEYDIAVEACPSPYLSPSSRGQLINYVKTVLSRYAGEFGLKDVRVSCADGPGRMAEMVDIYRSLGFYPRFAEYHTYKRNPEALKNTLNEVSSAIEGTGMELVLGEMLYHNHEQATVISDFLHHHPGVIAELIQWPVKDFDNKCTMDVEPPFTPGELGGK